MSFVAVQNSWTTWFKNLAVAPGWTVIYPNSGQDTPNNGTWLSVGFLWGTTNQCQLGVPLFRTPSIFEVQIHINVGMGSAPAVSIADTIMTAVRAAITSGAINGVRVQAPRMVNVGRVGNSFQVNVLCPFLFYEG